MDWVQELWANSDDTAVTVWKLAAIVGIPPLPPMLGYLLHQELQWSLQDILTLFALLAAVASIYLQICLTRARHKREAKAARLTLSIEYARRLEQLLEVEKAIASAKASPLSDERTSSPGSIDDLEYTVDATAFRPLPARALALVSTSLSSLRRVEFDAIRDLESEVASYTNWQSISDANRPLDEYEFNQMQSFQADVARLIVKALRTMGDEFVLKEFEGSVRMKEWYADQIADLSPALADASKKAAGNARSWLKDTADQR